MNISGKTIFKFWGILALFAIFAYLFFVGFQSILFIFIAFFLALMLHRPTVYLTQVVKSRTAAAGIVVFGLIIFIGLALFIVIPFFVTQVQLLLNTIPHSFSDAQSGMTGFVQFLNDNGFGQIYTEAITSLQSSISGIALDVSKNILMGFANVLSGLMNVVMIVMMVFFALAEGPHLMTTLWNTIDGDEKKEGHYRGLVHDGVNAISGYVYGTVIIGLLSAGSGVIVVGILSIFFDIPPLLIVPTGLILFVFAFIPMFGSFIGTVFVCVLLILYNAPATVLFIVIFTVLQLILNNVLVPKIFSKTVNLSPLVVLIAMSVGAGLLGMFGLLISIPAASCIKIAGKEIIAHTKSKKSVN
jgi:predicted PurR-regulated permease PerM